MIIKKRSVSIKELLDYLNDELEVFLPLFKKEIYKRSKGIKPDIYLENYFPSVILRAANKLERKGLVEKVSNQDGIVIKITDRGRKETLKYRLVDFKPKTGKWDGKWRMVFFDIPMTLNSKRDTLRDYLKMLGMKQMQESVWISPFDLTNEIKYLRELLDIPHAVKLAQMDYLENSEELKQIFGI